LTVIEVSNPASPLRVGGYDTLGGAWSVAVSGNYAYVADWDSDAGLQVIDVSNPTNCVRVGGGDGDYPTYATDVAAFGNSVYLLERDEGLLVFDLSNPLNSVLVGQYRTPSYFAAVTVDAGRIYLAAREDGLVVLPTLPNFQFTVRVNATPGTTFTLEAATHLTAPINWTPLLSTNITAMPFDYVDYDVKLSEKPQKFYRVRQSD